MATAAQLSWLRNAILGPSSPPIVMAQGDKRLQAGPFCGGVIQQTEKIKRCMKTTLAPSTLVGDSTVLAISLLAPVCKLFPVYDVLNDILWHETTDMHSYHRAILTLF